MCYSLHVISMPEWGVNFRTVFFMVNSNIQLLPWTPFYSSILILYISVYTEADLFLGMS